jgi:hypothetical protein
LLWLGLLWLAGGDGTLEPHHRGYRAFHYRDAAGRSTNAQHPIQYSHTDGSLGLLANKAADSQPWSSQQLVTTHCRLGSGANGAVRSAILATSALKWRPSNVSSTLFSLSIADPQPVSFRFKLSLRDLVEMMAERGPSVAHTTIMRLVKRYAPAFGKRWKPFARTIASYGGLARHTSRSRANGATSTVQLAGPAGRSTSGS